MSVESISIEQMARLEAEAQESKKAYEIKEVSSREELEFLKNDWAFTLVGMAPSEKNMEGMLKFIESHTPIFERKVWVTKGKLMNKVYGLTGSNAYADDLTIVSVPLSQVMFPDRLSLPKIACGGRWMWDVVQNDLRRQAEIDRRGKA